MLEVIVSDHTTTVFHHYHPHFGTQGRQRTYDKIIGALKVYELPGEELAIEHIRQKYRKNCKLPTIRTTADALRDFLRFLKKKEWGRALTID
jgi:hypothetical protein